VREIHAFPFLPERDRDRILGDNAVRFLGLDE
jgi:predicted TIM-barrel fold metal-dependent hydrolase